MIKTIFVGFIVGLLARAIKPGSDAMGWIMTIILGIAGASVGNYLAGFIGVGDASGIMHLAISVIGAIILLFVYELIFGKKKD